MSIPPAAIAITGILMPVVLVPITMTMRLRQQKRQWEHLERMKSLEMGLPAPTASRASGVIAIGAGVPMAAFLAAFLAMDFVPTLPAKMGIFQQGGPLEVDPELSIPLTAIIWGTAMTASIAAMLIAMILGIVQARALGRATQSNAWTHPHAKPAFDPEAYEFAGHRG